MEERPAEEARITIQEFARIEMKVARVLRAAKVEGSRKLLKLQVDLGGESRQVVAGIAEFYDPDQLVGRQVVIVANLKPARLMGEESDGMIVAASHEGRPYLVGVPDDCPIGAVLR